MELILFFYLTIIIYYEDKLQLSADQLQNCSLSVQDEISNSSIKAEDVGECNKAGK